MTSHFPPRRAIRIAIIDDHQLVLQGLSTLLASDPAIEIGGTFTSATQLLNTLKTELFDLVIMDYELAPNDTDGLNLIKTLTNRHSAVSILVVSSHYNPATVALALRAGVKGFVGKNGQSELILRAIHEIMAGKIFLEDKMAHQLANQVRHGELLSFESGNANNVQRAIELTALSPKEQEVIRCFITGMTVTEIADKFNRSLKTISGQKQSAMRKLGLKADHELFIIKDELLNLLNARA